MANFRRNWQTTDLAMQNLMKYGAWPYASHRAIVAHIVGIPCVRAKIVFRPATFYIGNLLIMYGPPLIVRWVDDYAEDIAKNLRQREMGETMCLFCGLWHGNIGRYNGPSSLSNWIKSLADSKCVGSKLKLHVGTYITRYVIVNRLADLGVFDPKYPQHALTNLKLQCENRSTWNQP